MKKKIIVLLLTAVVLLTACTSTDGNSSFASPDSASQSVTTESKEEAASTTEQQEKPDEETSNASSEVLSADETSQTTAETTSATTAETTTTTIATITATTTTKADTTTDSVTAPVEEKLIAITFDDGPNTTTTVKMLDLLEKYDIRATFFLIGDNINDESAKVVKRAYDMGCEIGNHSKTHSYMNEMSPDDIAAEIKYVSDKIYEITGEREKFFRPPYLATSSPMYAVIDQTFISGIGCNDWDPKTTVEKRAIYLEKKAKDGTIFLYHDAEGNDKTVEAMDIAIPKLLEQGFKFVTLSELFEAKGIELNKDDTKIYSTVPQEW